MRIRGSRNESAEHAHAGWLLVVAVAAMGVPNEVDQLRPCHNDVAGTIRLVPVDLQMQHAGAAVCALKAQTSMQSNEGRA